MADSKITALTALTAADPANDMMPIVDVSDTSMAASGTTKRISINNILACSPSATLASATITGDLTVDTNTLYVNSAANRVLIGTLSALGSATLSIAGKTQADTAVAGDVIGNFNNSSATGYGFRVGGGSGSGNYSLSINDYAGNEFYKIAGNGVATWSNVGGVAGTAMTLNATGLGVGGSPTSKLTIFAGADGDVGFFRGGSTRQLQLGTSATAGYLNVDNASAGFELRINGTARVYTDVSGNVGVGVGTFGTSAAKVLGLANATAPTTSPAGMGQLYVEAGALKYRGSSGTVTTIAAA